MKLFPCPCSHQRIWSRETAVPPRVSPLILHNRAESSIWCLCTHGIYPAFGSSVHSCKTKVSGANGVREIILFPVQLTTRRIGNLTRLILTLALCGDHTHVPSTAIGAVPSLSGQATGYQWRSLPRGRRRSANVVVLKVFPITVLPFQVSPWTNCCAPLFFYIHFWYVPR